MKIYYLATNKFQNSDSPEWLGYVNFSGTPNLKELVTLDLALGDRLIHESFIDTDWQHMLIEGDRMDTLFDDLDYLLKRVRDEKNYQILAVTKNPAKEEVANFNDGKFNFLGYDLLDPTTKISTLTNCGGWAEINPAADLTECGLIQDIEKAYEIKRILPVNYPDEPHAICDVWAIWRLDEKN